MSLANGARSPLGFDHIGATLKQTYGDLFISKQKLRKIERIELVRLKQETGQKTLAFTSRPFVLCGLPLRRPPQNTFLYERRNGHFKLQITGHPDFGLPYGQDRLIPIFLATLAVRQQSQSVRFKSGATILEMFGMAKGGKEYRRVVAAFERIFGATIFFGAENTTTISKVVHRTRFNFMQEARIWYQSTGEEDNVVALSDEFFAEVMAHPIPTDLNAITLLASSPGALDLFLWLSYRSFTVKDQQSIPLFGPSGLAAQLGSVEYSRPRRFTAKLEEWLQSIRAILPNCCVSLDSQRRRLIILPSHSMESIIMP